MLTAICLIGCTLCFLPALMGQIETEDDMLVNALTSNKNRDLAVAVIALSVPVFTEIAADYCTNIFVGPKSKRIKMHVREALLKPSEHLLLTCSILSVPVMAFLPARMDHLVATYLCFTRFRILLVGGLVIISLSRFDKKIWTKEITLLCVCLATVSCVVGSFADNLELVNYGKFADAVMIAGMGVFCLCSCRWFYISVPIVLRMKSKIHDVNELINQNSPGVAEQHLVFPLLYIISANVSAIFLAATMRSLPTLTFDAEWFFFNNLAFVVYLIILLTISERMAKYEVLQGLVSGVYCFILMFNVVTL